MSRRQQKLASHIQTLHVQRVLVVKRAPRFDLVAHRDAGPVFTARMSSTLLRFSRIGSFGQRPHADSAAARDAKVARPIEAALDDLENLLVVGSWTGTR